MARNKPRVWTDGLKGVKTESNPKGGGRVKGRDYSYLSPFPGSLREHRLSYSRMKAQAKFRGEPWDLSWEEYQTIWEGKWHLRGSTPDDMCLTRIDWDGVWCASNIKVVSRMEHWRKQAVMRPSQKGNKRGPYGPRKPKL